MLAVGIGPIGPFEGMIILLVVVLIFGVGKLSDLGGALGKSIREFRRAAREPEEPGQTTAAATTAPPPPAANTCTNCGAAINASSRFCAECGAPIGAAVN
jgi:sec-independent protein translocase protein TatA